MRASTHVADLYASVVLLIVKHLVDDDRRAENCDIILPISNFHTVRVCPTPDCFADNGNGAAATAEVEVMSPKAAVD